MLVSDERTTGTDAPAVTDNPSPGRQRKTDRERTKVDTESKQQQQQERNDMFGTTKKNTTAAKTTTTTRRPTHPMKARPLYVGEPLDVSTVAGFEGLRRTLIVEVWQGKTDDEYNTRPVFDYGPKIGKRSVTFSTMARAVYQAADDAERDDADLIVSRDQRGQAIGRLAVLIAAQCGKAEDDFLTALAERGNAAAKQEPTPAPAPPPVITTPPPVQTAPAPAPKPEPTPEPSAYDQRLADVRAMMAAGMDMETIARIMGPAPAPTATATTEPAPEAPSLAAFSWAEIVAARSFTGRHKATVEGTPGTWWVRGFQHRHHKTGRPSVLVTSHHSENAREKGVWMDADKVSPV